MCSCHALNKGDLCTYLFMHAGCQTGSVVWVHSVPPSLSTQQKIMDAGEIGRPDLNYVNYNTFTTFGRGSLLFDRRLLVRVFVNRITFEKLWKDVGEIM